MTARHVAPTLSGIALLYRLAGLYRHARTRESQSDYASALEFYQRLMRETIRALKDGCTDPVTANVSRLGTVVPNYIVECAYKTFRRGSIDRIFTLTVDLTRQGYPPWDYLQKVISDLVDNSQRTAGSSLRPRYGRSNVEVMTISKPAKIDGLNEIIQELSKSLGTDHNLTQHAKRAVLQI